MKYDKFFELAKAAGIEEAELYVETSYALSFSLFHGEVDNYSLENGSYYVARGIINGRFGAASCDVYNAQRAKYLVDGIVANAKIIENDDRISVTVFESQAAEIQLANRVPVCIFNSPGRIFPARGCFLPGQFRGQIDQMCRHLDLIFDIKLRFDRLEQHDRTG